MSQDPPAEPRLALRWTEAGQSRILPLPVDRPLILGRDADCDAVFEHQTVSRRHAMVYWLDGCAYLRPLSRVSPTWLEGRLVLGEAPLAVGDRLQLAIVAVELVRYDELDEGPIEQEGGRTWR